jgi:hypothetical protein
MKSYALDGLCVVPLIQHFQIENEKIRINEARLRSLINLNSLQLLNDKIIIKTQTTYSVRPRGASLSRFSNDMILSLMLYCITALK